LYNILISRKKWYFVSIINGTLKISITKIQSTWDKFTKKQR